MEEHCLWVVVWWSCALLTLSTLQQLLVPQSPDPRAALASSQRGQGSFSPFPNENVNRANRLQLQKSLWVSQVLVPEPGGVSASQPSRCRQFFITDLSAGALRPCHTCCTVLSTCAAWAVRQPVPPEIEPLPSATTGSSNSFLPFTSIPTPIDTGLGGLQDMMFVELCKTWCKFFGPCSKWSGLFW